MYVRRVVVNTAMRLLFGVINGELHHHHHLPYHADCFVNVFHHIPLNYDPLFVYK